MTNQQPRYHMYVSFQDDDKIAIFTMDPATGGLDWQEDVVVEGGPAPLAIAPAKNLLYVGRRGKQEISSSFSAAELGGPWGRSVVGSGAAS